MQPDVSVILPVYLEEENVAPLFKEIYDVMTASRFSFEVIAIDDGSYDKSVEKLEEMASTYPHVTVVALRKNYGQATAFTAGFSHVTGKYVVTMDSDLQNDPRDIPQMLDKLEKEDLDFISGWRKNRQDNVWLRTLPSKMANSLIRWVTKTKLHDLGCSLKVYRAEVVSELKLYGEMHRFINVLVDHQGFRSGELVVNHRARIAGHSKYGLKRTFKVVLDLLIVWFLNFYQTKSIYIYGGVGAVTLGLSGLLGSIVLFQKFVLEIWVHKNPLFILSVILGVVSVQFFGLGIMAEVLSRTYFEAQGKSTYRIRSTTRSQESLQQTGS